MRETIAMEGPLGLFLLPAEPISVQQHTRNLSSGVFNGEYEHKDLPLHGIDGSVLDVGAGWGAFAVWAKKKWPNANIVCYEPNETSRELLVKNAPWAAVTAVAVTSQEAATLTFGDDWGGGNVLGTVYGGLTQTREVHAFRPRDLPQADILKCDAEGVEFDVISNYRYLDQLKACLYEWHTHDLRKQLHVFFAARPGWVELKDEGAGENFRNGVALWIRKELRPAVTMMAYHRPLPEKMPVNFQSTIASALLADSSVQDHDFSLVLDSLEFRSAEVIKHLVNVDLLTEAQELAQRPRWGGTRSLLSLSRCLEKVNDDGIVVLEDDLSFSPAWLRRVEEAVGELSKKTNRFLLFLYYGNGDVTGVLPQLTSEQRADGTIGVYFSAAAAREAKAALDVRDFDKVCSYNFDRPLSADAFIANWRMWKDVPVFVLNPNVVQHYGVEGLNASWSFGHSKTFDESKHPRLRFSPIEENSDRFVKLADVAPKPIAPTSEVSSMHITHQGQYRFKSNGSLTTIQDFTQTPDAERLYAYLDEEMPPEWWTYSFHSPHTWLPDNEANALAIVGNKQASLEDFLAGKISYRFRRTTGHHTTCPCPVCETTKLFGGKELLDHVSAVLGYPVTLATSFASWYSSLDFLSPHSDKGNGDVAFVWNLTKNWKPQYGGMLHILKDDWVELETVCLPRFNELTLFDVEGDGLPHFVGHVAPLVEEKRLAFSGWFKKA
jgi:FkbM family methyltransferase